MGMDTSHGLHKLCGLPHGGQILKMMAFSKVFQVFQALLRGLIFEKSYKKFVDPLICFSLCYPRFCTIIGIWD
jgi:hypothetical protein